MKIKVCGLRQPENLASVAQLPIDFVGMVFHPASARFVEGDTLRDWLAEHGEQLGAVKRVGVFVNAEIDYILNTVHDYALDFVQLHGEEGAGYCRELNTLWSVSSMHRARIIKAFRIHDSFDFHTTNEYAAACPLFVFDTHLPGAAVGGTGQQFDWELLDHYQGLTPFFLSGGIGPDDVRAVQSVRHPQFYGVDVNSKFESEPGAKDIDSLRQFTQMLKI